MLTKKEALQGAKELLNEEYGFSAVRIYLNDLVRSKEITWQDVTDIELQLYDEGFDCSIKTY